VIQTSLLAAASARRAESGLLVSPVVLLVAAAAAAATYCTVEQAKVTGCIGRQAGEGEGIDQVVFAFLDIRSVSFSSSCYALLQFAHQNLPQ